MYHIVWTPKYRKRVLKGVLAERIKELLIQCAEINRWEVHEMNVQIDHIHVILQLDTRTSVAWAVQMFKGGSSKKIREEFPELEEFLWGDSLWSDGYFAETVGRVDEEVIKKYVRNQ
jgi:putative transposase